MPQFSQNSYAKLDSCDSRLRRVMERAIKLVPLDLDFTILEGHRGQQAQDAAFEQGKSQLKWPNGNHNKYPSLAVDVAPYPIDWNNKERFYLLATYIFKAAYIEGVDIKWGGHWPHFKDLPHWEVKSEL